MMERIAIDMGEELHRLNDMLESAMRHLEGARNAPRPSAADRDSMTFRKRPDSLQRSNAEMHDAWGGDSLQALR